MARDSAHNFEVGRSIDEVVEASRKLLDTEKRPIERGQHPKQHACVRAKFVIARDLAATHRQGLFREEKVYDAWIRFSSGGQHDDRKPDAHGMAIKLMGVEGPKALPSERESSTQDFVMVDHPTFFLRDATEYAEFSQLLLKAKGKAPSSVYNALGYLMAGPMQRLATLLLLSVVQWKLPAFLRLIKFASKRIASPLSTRYYSTTPYKFGDTCMKFSAVPAEFPAGVPADGPADESYGAMADFLGPAVASQLSKYTASHDSRDYLRESLARALTARGDVFLFEVQLFQGKQATPIDDPTVEWPEDVAPFQTVAYIWIPKQVCGTPARMAFGEALSFSPWHALADHAPLGEINAVRKDVYSKLSLLRHRLNGVDEREPSIDDPDPDELPPRWGDDSSAFDHVLDAELDLIEERRRHVAGPPVDRHYGRHRHLSVVAAGDETGRATGRALDTASVAPLASSDVDARTRQARLRASAAHATGLALTGEGAGGAAFAVGFFQGLASLGLLRQIDYLSAVSGGSYAAGWLAGWLKREGGDPANVERQLASSRVVQASASRQYLAAGEVVDEEPETLRPLRSDAGSVEAGATLLSTDAWIGAFTWARNVVVHLFVLMPLLVLLVAGARLIVVPYRLLGHIGELDQLAAEFDSRLRGAIFALGVFTLGFLFLAGTVAIESALSSIAESLRKIRRRPADPSDETESESVDPTAWINSKIVSPLLVGALLLTLCLPPVARGLAERFESMSLGLETGSGLAMRTLFDAARSYLSLLGWPSVVAHALAIGGLWSWRTSRRTRVADLARQAVLARASFAAGALGGVYLVLVEAFFRWVMERGRFDLAATLVPPFALLTVGAIMIVEVALSGRAACDRERAWWTAVGALLSRRALFWAAGMATFLYLPGVVFAASPLVRAAGVVVWLGAAALGVFIGRRVLPRVGRRPARWLFGLASATALLFFAGLATGTALFVSLLANVPSLTAPGGDDDGAFAYYLQGVEGTSIATLMGITIVSAVVYALARRLLDVNLFSLDALHAERLSRVYLGASRPTAGWLRRWRQPRDQREPSGAPSLADPALPVRDPDALTGIDGRDDLALSDLCIGKKTDQDRVYWGPHLLLCATVRSSALPGAAGRRPEGSESFFLSPLYCGCASTGYARTENSKPAAAVDSNLPLGRAMAVSGASASCGDRPLLPGPLSALLTVLSAQPGLWIEKPKPDGWAADSPAYADLSAAAAFGLGAGDGDFLCLSGGGDFERLAAYELIRRRCRYIIAVDGGSTVAQTGSPTEPGLAALARRCLVDFGIRIEISIPRRHDAASARLGGTDLVIGRIHYGDVDQGAPPGVLVYIGLWPPGLKLPRTSRRGGLEQGPSPACERAGRMVERHTFECSRRLGSEAAEVVFADAVARLRENHPDDAPQSPVEFAPRLFAALVDRWVEPATAQLEG
jgi:hypothetical protein